MAASPFRSAEWRNIFALAFSPLAEQPVKGLQEKMPGLLDLASFFLRCFAGGAKDDDPAQLQAGAAMPYAAAALPRQRSGDISGRCCALYGAAPGAKDSGRISYTERQEELQRNGEKRRETRFFKATYLWLLECGIINRDLILTGFVKPAIMNNENKIKRMFNYASAKKRCPGSNPGSSCI